MNRITSTLDDLGIRYDIHASDYYEKPYYALIEFHTDYAGQDVPIEFDFDGTAEDFVSEFEDRTDMYDVDEEVAGFVPLMGICGVPSSVMDIVLDCQEVKDTLTEIADKLKCATKEHTA